MCGILGGVVRDGAVPDPREVEVALSLIAHRGPDAQGFCHGQNWFMGHRRLSILDLDPRANQPMRHRKLLITFNGEIYNFRELRRELEQRGHTFGTTSDTEVLLSAYAEYGPACLDRLEGMFAFAILDEERGMLFLARDRFGEKPLFYFNDGRSFLFCSEVPPIEALLTPSRLEESPEAIGLYFLYSYIPAPHAPYRNMRQLEPGSWLEFDVARWTERAGRYFDLGTETAASRIAPSYGEAVECLRHLLRQSVQLRLAASDVPVATFLSGGIDSSIITVLASEASSHPLSAYSVTFPDDPDFDESEYAQAVARRLPGVRHQVIPVREQDMIEFVRNTASVMGEPFADASLIPTAFLCSHVQEKVILGGDGADELFAGYGVYPALQLSHRLPVWLKRLIYALPGPTNPITVRNRSLRAFALFRQHLGSGPLEEYLSWRQYEMPDFLESLGLMLGARDDVLARLAYLRSGKLRGFQVADIEFNLPNDMLKKVDCASMFHSLEVRLPYLDRDLVRYVLALPDAFKMKGRLRKRILRDAFGELLPPEVLSRGKQGFLLPLRSWFKNGQLCHDLTELVAEQTLFNHTVIKAMLADHRIGKKDNSIFLWTLYMYLMWRRRRHSSVSRYLFAAMR